MNKSKGSIFQLGGRKCLKKCYNNVSQIRNDILEVSVCNTIKYL
jgi:hypothetical protein